ncbi:MAG: DASH family cryptochrome [Hydrogenophaga sp.]|uniref:DASH family cryptochrome n=1 Tax=Hydrogenophaga sp. TaxID=1904254 RepID=UPI0026273AF3|nr:DASH family cryptochrome [Hydrogenophaga sp.]MDM7942834.1 DASH family cryptochrome [Hydrogenophaga sp.]
MTTEASTLAPGARTLYWFRNDLRLGDNPALAEACAASSAVLPVVCHDPAQDALTRWGFVRRGLHRQHFVSDAMADLAARLETRGSRLVQVRGRASEQLAVLVQAWQIDRVVTEDIAAPEELDEVRALRAAGVTVHTRDQSGLFDRTDLPFAAHQVPDVFTAFRQAVEHAGVRVPAVVPVPAHMPPAPDAPSMPPPGVPRPVDDPRSSFPCSRAAFSGGESAGLAHLQRYFDGPLARQYKATRNQLSGTDYSTKFSPWLACGALSARQIHAALHTHETRVGASDGSRWIVFELLWREHFRLLHLRHGRALYRARGLSDLPAPPHEAAAFGRWCRGETGEPLVDAGMRELLATGYLSNRLRQVVASYLIHDLACDWRAGAAWFESRLVDFDVHSNQGNWLYIAGRGTDPRGGRRFNLEKQTRDHDADGRYRALWLT